MISNNKHILIIPSWYKTPKQPITGTFFEEQARMFQKRGHQVGILFPDFEPRFMGINRGKSEPTPEPFEDQGIPVYYAFTQSYIPKYDYPSAIDLHLLKKNAYKVYQSYKKKYGKPEVMHAHSTTWGGVVAAYISKKEGIPFFLTEHFTGWILNTKRLNSQIYHKLLKTTIDKSEHTFMVSSFFRKKLIEHYNVNVSKLKVVHNVVNPMFYENKNSIKPSVPFCMITISYLIERKNHITLFKAIKLLKEKGHKIRLDVVGDGMFKSELVKFVRENHLENEVVFLGLLDRKEVMEALKNVHALVSASAFETFGVNIIEALAIGRPVIVYNSGGPEDIVRPQDGVLFNENTPEAFSKAIQYVVNNYETYDQMQIAEDCMARFGEETIYKQLANYYNKLV